MFDESKAVYKIVYNVFSLLCLNVLINVHV